MIEPRGTPATETMANERRRSYLSLGTPMFRQAVHEPGHSDPIAQNRETNATDQNLYFGER